MTTEEYHALPLSTKADAAEVLNSNRLEDVLEYIHYGSDGHVTNLLQSMQLIEHVYAKEDWIRIVMTALFPGVDLLRFGTGVLSFRSAKRHGVELEVKRIIEARSLEWNQEGQYNAFFAG